MKAAIASLFSNIRPQILIVIVALSAIGLYALRIGNSDVTIGCVAGMIGLSGKILDKD